jgi:hypothetical protein
MNEMPIIVSGLGDIEIADGPYDHEDYREITDYTKHTASRATTDAPRPFPRAQPGEIIVDGDLADWSAIPALCRPHKKQLTVHAPERYKFATYKTLKGEAKVAYDDEHFYIACKVRKDRKAQVDPNVANVLLSMRGFDLGVQWSHFCKGQSLIALMSRPGGPNVIQLGGYDMSIAERELTEAKIATRIEPREIIFEAAIPWDAFRPIKPVPGKFAELLLVFGGDDGNDYYWWYRLLGAHWFSLPPAEQVELKF